MAPVARITTPCATSRPARSGPTARVVLKLPRNPEKAVTSLSVRISILGWLRARCSRPSRKAGTSAPSMVCLSSRANPPSTDSRSTSTTW